MFESLQRKWGVNGFRLLLILCTFAIGGSLTGYAARKLLPVFSIDNRFAWTVTYILLVTLLWPLAVLIVSIPLGQYSFFRNYIRKIGTRMGIIRSQEARGKGQEVNIRIAIFASGAGSNAEQIIRHLKNHPFIRVSLIVCNKRGAGVLQIAGKNGIETLLVEKERFFRGDAYTAVLIQKDIRFVVLAGFLWKIPSKLISTYPNRIINIHPALLPKYGGKGMFGSHVHEAVISNKEKSSGISVHYVDELYDHGSVIFQASCPVYESDDAVSLAQRIHALEHKYYPGVVERLATAIGA